MPQSKHANKVAAKEFVEGPKMFLDAVEGGGAPLFITTRNKPVAVLISAKDYEYSLMRLERYEQLITNLEAPEKARMKAHAAVIADISRRGRKL
jgi:prevent-host-death family protein